MDWKGLGAHPNENNILAYAEEIRDKTDKCDVCGNKPYSKSKIKNSLPGLAFIWSIWACSFIERKLRSYNKFAKILQY